MSTANKTIAAQSITGFSVALASLGASLPAEAGVVNLFANFAPAGGNSVVSVRTPGNGIIGGFIAANSQNTQSVQRFVALDGALFTILFDGLRLATTSSIVDPGDGFFSSPKRFDFPSVSAASQTFGFLSGANVGWFRLQFLPIDSAAGRAPIIFTGAYDDMGNPIHVVPLPPALPLMGLGLLALGAQGLRKMRKERRQAAGAPVKAAP